MRFYVICFSFIFTLFAIPSLAQETESFYVISVNGKKGFMNESGKMVINLKFDDAKNFSEGFAIVRVDETWGFIDRTGNLTTFPKSVRHVRDFSEGLAIVVEEKSYGFADTSGKIVINSQFESAFDFSEGLASIRKSGKWQYIDKTGKVVIDTDFDYADNFHESRAVVAKYFKDEERLKVAYIDKSGKLISDWFNFASRFSEGIAFVSNDPRISAGISRRFGLGFDSFNGTVLEKNLKYRAMDNNGKIIFENVFDDVYGFSGYSEGLADIVIDGKVGFIDKQGKLVIKPRFDSATRFSEGIAYVGIGDKRYFIDRSGEILFETEFSLNEGFRNGLAYVMSCKILSCKNGYIDRNGKLIAYDR